MSREGHQEIDSRKHPSLEGSDAYGTNDFPSVCLKDIL